MSHSASRQEPHTLGAFHYHLGLLSFTQTEEGATALNAVLNGELAPAELRQDPKIAFETGAYLHELQHFADVFGTVAGTSLLQTGLRSTKQFADLCDESDWRAAHAPAGTPDQKWLDKRAAILRAARFAVAAERVFSRPFEAFESEAPIDDLFVEVQPSVLGTPSRRIVNGVRRTLIEPLGFEAFTEASAHAHVRSILDQGFPDLSVAGEFRVHVIQPDSDGLGDPRSYMTVDILLSRWFRDAGIENFPRSLVHQIIEHVLGRSCFAFGEVGPAGVRVPIHPPGIAFRELLRELDPHEICVRGIPRDADADRDYLAVADGFDRGDDWDTVEGHRYGRAVRIWETWVAKHVSGPLMRLRANCNGPLLKEALRAAADLVPVVARNGFIVRCEMPQEVRAAWVQTAFLTSVLHQLAHEGDAHCPRRYESLPGLRSILNLARRGTCETNAELGCGSTAGFLAGGEFDCLFEDVVRSSHARSRQHA